MDIADCEKMEGMVITDFSEKLGDEDNCDKSLSIRNEYLDDGKTSDTKCNQIIETEENDFEDPLQSLSERWSPLGASYDDTFSPTSEFLSPHSESELLSSESHDNNDTSKLSRFHNMEEEQEMLTSSLMALTSHFAHVQLRVRQIVEAPTDKRDELLKDLEKIAFRGIPEPLSSESNSSSDTIAPSDQNEELVRQRQYELIDHLKLQLSDLEKLAYDSGARVLPQHILLEKQKIIIDELKMKLNFKVEDEDLPYLSSEELKNQVDNAFGEFVGPIKMTEQLVAQLKTQISDLERFIAFLQCDSDDCKIKSLNEFEKFNVAYNSYAAKKKGTSKQSATQQTNAKQIESEKQKSSDIILPNPSTSHSASDIIRESLNSKAHSLMDKASLLVQMFATTHFGTKSDNFQKNSLKKTAKGNHWGDLRAQLEVDIQEVASLAATLNIDREKLANMKRALETSRASYSAITTVPYPSRVLDPFPHLQDTSHPGFIVSSDSDDDDFDYMTRRRNYRRISHSSAHYRGDSISTINKELTTTVRKSFAMTLLKLIQHGLRLKIESPTAGLMVPFMRCINPSRTYKPECQNNCKYINNNSYVGTSSFFSKYDVIDSDDRFNTSYFGSTRQMHAWELITEYYYLKNGDEYNNTPARKLSESFNLDIVDSRDLTTKQSLLRTIGTIISTHRPYKRSRNAHFKAFICAGLNEHQLVEWLNLIFSCKRLINTYYMPNSYVMRTGFRDSLRSIDGLTKYDFDLPVDLAIRHFKNL